MKKMNRRTFLKTAAVTAAITSPILATTKEHNDDYKALVCVLLDGGADTVSMVVPKYKANAHTEHQAIKGEITPHKDTLKSLLGSRYGLHPKMSKMQSMYNHRRLAVVANVGALVHPVNKSEMESYASNITLPHGLFSKMGQQNHWMMSGHSDKGWAGAVAEALAQEGTNISMSGENLMQYNDAYETMIAYDDIETISLEKQLEKVVELMAKREELDSPKRQIYFVKHTGWDTAYKSMDEMKANDSVMVTELDNALDKFNTKLAQLQLDKSVTTFTMSDASRITSADSHGLNYGWGGHAFVMGGAVKAGIYGKMPKIAANSDDILLNTALIPTTSTDQYLATMVDWLCDGKVDLHKVFPNLKHFETDKLKFIA